MTTNMKDVLGSEVTNPDGRHGTPQNSSQEYLEDRTCVGVDNKMGINIKRNGTAHGYSHSHMVRSGQTNPTDAELDKHGSARECFSGQVPVHHRTVTEFSTIYHGTGERTRNCDRVETNFTSGNVSSMSNSNQRTPVTAKTWRRNSELYPIQHDVFHKLETSSVTSCGCACVPRIRETATSRRRFEMQHAQHEQNGQCSRYKTPTQRKEQELRQMKTRLRETSSLLSDKEDEIRHLEGTLATEYNELLDLKSKEIENLNKEIDVLRFKCSELEIANKEQCQRVVKCDKIAVADNHGDGKICQGDSIDGVPASNPILRNNGDPSDILNPNNTDVDDNVRETGQNDTKRVIEESYRTCEKSHVHKTKQADTDGEIERLQKTVTDLQDAMAARELEHEEMYLLMYQKGMKIAQIQRGEELDDVIHGSSPSAQCTTSELTRKLATAETALAKWQVMRLRESYENEAHKPETEAEVVLHFLRDSFYHYLTDSANSSRHLQAMIRIFEFSGCQKREIEKSLSSTKSKIKKFVTKSSK